MPSPDDRKYLKSHEWCKKDSGLVVVGITQFAADELTDITFVDLPEVGRELQAGSSFGEIESVKATSEVFAPISGVVKQVNTALDEDPGLLNRDPFGEGWIIKIEPVGEVIAEGLMDAADYDISTGKS